MTDTQIAKLARLKNRSTRYEWTLKHFDGRTLLLGYCRPTERGAHDYIRALTEERYEALQRVFAAGFALNGYTRTQREAIMGGELTWFGDVAV